MRSKTELLLTAGLFSLVTAAVIVFGMFITTNTALAQDCGNCSGWCSKTGCNVGGSGVNCRTDCGMWPGTFYCTGKSGSGCGTGHGSYYGGGQGGIDNDETRWCNTAQADSNSGGGEFVVTHIGDNGERCWAGFSGNFFGGCDNPAHSNEDDLDWDCVNECPAAPGEPTSVTCTLDTVNRTGTLSWAPPFPGTIPTDYALRIIEDGQGSDCSTWFFCDTIPSSSTSYTWDANYTPSAGGDIFSTYSGWMEAVYSDPPQCYLGSQSVGFVPCTAPPTCNVSAFTTGNLQLGTSDASSLSIDLSNIANGTFGRIDIAPRSTQIRITPATIPPPPYPTEPSTRYSALIDLDINPTAGIQTIDIYAYATANPGSSICQTTANVLIEPEAATYLPWWQVVGGDIISMTGDIISTIPGSSSSGFDFGSRFKPLLVGSQSLAQIVEAPPDLPEVPAPSTTLDLVQDGTGGFPGIPYYSGYINPDANSTPGISRTNWNVDSGMSFPYAQYDYTHFREQVPSNITLTPISGLVANDSFVGCINESDPDYCWYESTGNLTLGSQGLTNERVVLFVDGNLNINGPINFNDGRGFFMAVVNGNINIAGSIGASPVDLEGIYFMGGDTTDEFNAGTAATQLNIRGVVSSMGGINMDGRDRGSAINETEPSIQYINAPDVLLNFPRALINRDLRWIGEVSP